MGEGWGVAGNNGKLTFDNHSTWTPNSENLAPLLSKSFKIINVNTTKKLVTSDSYDKQHVYA